LAELDPADTIVGVVLELLESGGPDAVQLREVARRAHVSLTTIYKLFATRDELIIVAMEHWMSAHICAPVPPPAQDESLYDGLMRVFRHVFEPWERSPRMLESFDRARSAPGGQRLDRQAMNTIAPVALALLADGDPTYVDDISMILTNLAYAMVGQFADGTLDATDILPTLERAVYRLTTNNAPAAEATRTRRVRTRR
jgi:AcrR family transcriptional regulator